MKASLRRKLLCLGFHFLLLLGDFLTVLTWQRLRRIASFPVRTSPGFSCVFSPFLLSESAATVKTLFNWRHNVSHSAALSPLSE